MPFLTQRCKGILLNILTWKTLSEKRLNVGGKVDRVCGGFDFSLKNQFKGL